MKLLKLHHAKRSSLTLLLLSIILLTALEVILPQAYADPTVVIAVDPAENVANLGESFTVNVTIADVTDLFSYEAKLGFNDTVLEAISVDEGPFIIDQTTSPSGTYFAPIIEDDYVYAACVTLGMYPGVSGSGVLFTVTFNVIAYGESVLDLYDTILIDSTNTQISHDIVDGYFSTPAMQYELVIAVEGSGTTDPAPGVYTYDEGTAVPVTAYPVEGWLFDHWILDGSDVGTDNPITVNMDADHALTAVFVESSAWDVVLSAGWNMVSFPCLPVDATWDDVLGECGFYQVLTWDGTGYIAPPNLEFGVGYWVLVLEPCTVTITNGIPCESYERCLDPGWSMIGSIFPCVVEADCVFPDFYQLLTWDGTGYVTSTTIEPGKGYWALVLEETCIVVDSSCCI